MADHGFGVLSEIDVQAVLRAKLDATIEDYVILRRLQSQLATRALEVDRDIGLLLSCNVAVRADAESTLVQAVDPDLLVAHAGRPALQPVAAEARASLAAALRDVAQHSTDPAL